MIFWHVHWVIPKMTLNTTRSKVPVSHVCGGSSASESHISSRFSVWPNHLSVTGHFVTSALNDPQIIIISKILIHSVCITTVPEFKISLYFTLRPSRFRVPSHFMTSTPSDSKSICVEEYDVKGVPYICYCYLWVRNFSHFDLQHYNGPQHYEVERTPQYHIHVYVHLLPESLNYN